MVQCVLLRFRRAAALSTAKQEPSLRSSTRGAGCSETRFFVGTAAPWATYPRKAWPACGWGRAGSGSGLVGGGGLCAPALTPCSGTVPPSCQGLAEYCTLIDSSSSFRAYRAALSEVEPPCIPYL